MYCRRFGAKSYRERFHSRCLVWKERERGADLKVLARLWLTRQIPMVRADWMKVSVPQHSPLSGGTTSLCQHTHISTHTRKHACTHTQRTQHTQAHTHTQSYTYASKHAHTHTRASAYTTHTQGRMHTHAHTTHASIHTRTHAHTCTHTRTHTHTCTHTHAHTHTRTFSMDAAAEGGHMGHSRREGTPCPTTLDDHSGSPCVLQSEAETQPDHPHMHEATLCSQ